MLKTIENNSVILIDPDQETEVVAELLLRMNAFASIKTAELATTLDKTTQYRERLAGRFPSLVSLTRNGRRKGYRLQDLKSWLHDPANFERSYLGCHNSPHLKSDR